jgi:hypothetical protein
VRPQSALDEVDDPGLVLDDHDSAWHGSILRYRPGESFLG